MRFLKMKKIYHLISKKETFYNPVAERTGEIENLHNSVNFHNLVYHFKGPIKNINFNDFIDIETLFDDIKSKKIRFEYAAKNKMEFQSKLSSSIM